MNYDVIGDIHGQAAKLEALLIRLGYSESAEGWVAPAGHQAIFLGDLIDRGPEQIKVVNIVRSMIDRGQAHSVMGNHEYNAIAYVRERLDADGNPIPGQYLRNRSPNKVAQHTEFLRQVGEGSELHMELVEWFRSLPVYLDLGDIRVVHAWWYQPHVDLIAGRWNEGEPLPEDLLHAAHDKGSPEYDAMEGLCKGLEIGLPDPHFFIDHNGQKRRNVRAKWWHESPNSFRDVAIVGGDEQHRIPDHPLPEDYLAVPVKGSPVFIGHYWMEGRPHLMARTVAGLDWSAAKGDEPLVAYRCRGEAELDAANYVASHGSID
jgi:hypothetical protein